MPRPRPSTSPAIVAASPSNDYSLGLPWHTIGYKLLYTCSYKLFKQDSRSLGKDEIYNSRVYYYEIK